MASLNTSARELVLKIVYYGPGLGGKTTSLQSLHDSAPPERRGTLVALATPVDRTLYFDFLPLRLPPLRGLSVRLQLFTVPGQVYFNATRRLVLSGSDGIVFVADSQLDRVDSNMESLENLRENLAEHGRDLATMPHVFAWNKRDLDGLMPIDDLERALNRHGAASFGTVATKGTGVDQVLEKITALVTTAYEAQLPASPSSLIQSPGLISLSPARMTLRGANGEEEIISSVFADRPPPSLATSLTSGEAEQVVTSSSLMTPSEGTFLADLDRLEASASRPPPEEPEELESVVGHEWDKHLTPPPPESAAETRRATPEDLAAAAIGAGVRRGSTAPAPAMTAATPVPLTFAPLFAPTERPLVEQIEASIAHGAYADALGMCEAALSRLMGAIASLASGDNGPSAPNDPAIPLLIGLDGRRYLAFRALARRARQIGDVGVRDVLESYAFLLDAKVAAGQWDALRGALGATSAAPPAPRPSTAPPALPPLPRGSITPPSTGERAASASSSLATGRRHEGEA
ncbi:MAG: gliding motility protein [Polyangiales bacterium]